MKSYTIHFIRHGITQGNESGRYIGRTDLPLSPGGERELERLKQEYPYPEVQACFTSPLLRCIQTARILYPWAKPIVIDGFRECDFGDWEGKTAREIAETDPRFRQWVSGGGDPVAPPNGESGGQFARRVCASFEKAVEGMLRSGVTSAALVAHGGTLMAILSAYGLPKAEFYDWMTENGCGYSMRIIPGLWMRSKIGEVYDTIPKGLKKQEGPVLIDLAREAADRAFGKEKEEK